MSHKVATDAVGADGVRLAVQVTDGPGPTVVAVHGFPDDHTVWDGVVADLAADHRVVTYDVRGAGGSEAAGPGGYGLDTLAADLHAVLDAVSPGEPVHLLAHDWGAIASWHAVTDAAFAGRIASYTSVSGPCLDHIAAWYRRPRTARSVREMLRQARASWYTLLFRLPLLPELLVGTGVLGRAVAATEGVPCPARRDARNGLRLYRENIAARMARPEQRRTDVPVLVLAPRRDRYVTPALQTSAVPFASDVRVRGLDGGHWVVRQRPEMVADCVREHVARTA